MTTALIPNFDLLATAPGGVARLRELILTLAVQGKLVAQHAGDEPASVVLGRIRLAEEKNLPKANQRSFSNKSEEPPAPYELPKHWSWARLGNLVENMGSGWSPACDEGERIDSTRWAVLRTTAVQVMEYRPREHKAIPQKLSPRPEIEVKNGDILITRAGPMNRVGISCCVDQTPARLMLSDKIVRFHSIADELFPPFVVLSLNAGWTKSQIEQAKTGMAASQVNISQSDIRNLWIPVCSKAEQSRIVTRVEELMRLCDALENQRQLEDAQHTQLLTTLLGTLTDSTSPDEPVANWQRVSDHFDLLLDRPEAVDALEQTILQLAVRGLLVPQDPADEPASVLLARIRAEKDRLIQEKKIKREKPLSAGVPVNEMPFALPRQWAWTRLGFLGESFDYGTSQKTGDDIGATPVLRMGNLQEGKIVLNNLKYLADQEGDLPKLLLRANDLLFNRTNSFELVGKTARFEGHARDMSFASYLIRIRLVHPLCHPEYINLYMNTADCRSNEIVPDLTQQTGQANYNGSKLKNIRVPLPPLHEQARIVARVAELRQVCAFLRQRLSTRNVTQRHLAEELVEI